MDERPSPNGENGGRDASGRFTKGNPGGPGNPFARQVGQLRAAMLNAVDPKDVQEIIEAVVTKAKEGDLRAAKLLLDYSVGRPVPATEPPGDGPAGAHADDPVAKVIFTEVARLAAGKGVELLPGLPMPDVFGD